MEQTKLKRFERIIQKCCIILLCVIASLAIMRSCEFCQAKKPLPMDYESTGYYAQCIYPDSTAFGIVIPDKATKQINIRTQLTIRDELIDEVQKYIYTKTIKFHRLIPNYIVLAGLENDIDICFMMAQTQVETCYGTLGAGRETSRRSLFGVAQRKYCDYETAIDHYCELLHKYYLKNGRTEQHLMNKYVTVRGARYAENPNYEREIKTAYNHIKRNTNIYNLQQEYKNMS